MTDEKNQTDKAIPALPEGFDMAAFTAAITEQVMNDLESKEERERVARQQAREAEREKHEAYLAEMKASKDPWVEVIGAVEDTADGVRIALEWNDAFVSYLKAQGVGGTDEEQVVQHWVTLILRDMAEQMDSEGPEESDFT